MVLYVFEVKFVFDKLVSCYAGILKDLSLFHKESPVLMGDIENGEHGYLNGFVHPGEFQLISFHMKKVIEILKLKVLHTAAATCSTQWHNYPVTR